MADVDTMIGEIEAVVQDVTGDYDVRLKPETCAADVPGWDSLAHMNIVIGLEKKLGIRLSAAELGSLKGGERRIADFAELLAAKQAG